MAMQIIIYDPANGKIIGRIIMGDPAQIINYPSHLKIGTEVTQIEFDLQPEIFDDVDVARRELKEAPVDEVVTRLFSSVKPEDIERRRAEALQRQEERKRKIGRM